MPAAMLLAALALVPQPTEVVEKEGFCEKPDSIVVSSDASIPAEGYKLKITTDGITIASSDDAGAFYAKVTLGQLAVKDGKATKYPCVEITDAPRYRWRGIHFDDCRHFFGKETLLGVLDLMAAHLRARRGAVDGRGAARIRRLQAADGGSSRPADR